MLIILHGPETHSLLYQFIPWTRSVFIPDGFLKHAKDPVHAPLKIKPFKRPPTWEEQMRHQIMPPRTTAATYQSTDGWELARIRMEKRKILALNQLIRWTRPSEHSQRSQVEKDFSVGRFEASKCGFDKGRSPPLSFCCSCRHSPKSHKVNPLLNTRRSGISADVGGHLVASRPIQRRLYATVKRKMSTCAAFCPSIVWNHMCVNMPTKHLYIASPFPRKTPAFELR